MKIFAVKLAGCRSFRLLLAAVVSCCWTVNVGSAAEIAASASRGAVRAPSAKPVRSITVSLRKDGTLVGRSVRPDGSKQLIPLRAKVTFYEPDQIGPVKQVKFAAGDNPQAGKPQAGLVVNAVWSNEDGYFQVPGLTPGKYRVTGQGRRMSGSVDMNVVPYTHNDPDHNQWFDFVLDENATPGEGEEVAADPALMQPMDAAPPMMGPGGGGGAGGGGLGAALGIAGLVAGLAGLGGSSSSSPPASPTSP